MKRIVCCLFQAIVLLLGSQLAATPKEMRLGAEYAPLATACDCVNLISGDFFFGVPLANIEAPVPLKCAQYYDSGVMCFLTRGTFAIDLPIKVGLVENNGRWGTADAGTKVRLLIDERQDAPLKFEGTCNGSSIDATVSPDLFKHGYTNYYEGLKGSESLRNRTLHFSNIQRCYISPHFFYRYGDCTVTLGSGGTRYYTYFGENYYWDHIWLLDHEKKPNGHLVHMRYYEQDTIAQVATSDAANQTTFNWLDFEDQSDGFVAKTSDNHSTFCRVEWCTGKMGKDKKKVESFAPFITEIVSSRLPHMWFNYIYKLDNQDARWQKLNRVTKPDGRYLGIDYDSKTGKVVQLTAPLSKNGATDTLASFVYHGGATDHYDALKQKTTYRISPQKTITAIERYTGADRQTTLYSSQKFVWGTHEPNQGALLAKGLTNADGRYVNYTTAAYDANRNLIKQKAFGNFTGTGQEEFAVDTTFTPVGNVECFSTEYTYSNDGYNLLLEERFSDGKYICYRYQPQSNLLVAKQTGFNGRILQREFYAYDDGVASLAIFDDGCGTDANDLTHVTVRKITHTHRHPAEGMAGLPESVRECYLDLKLGIEKQLKRVVYHYNAQHLVTQEDIYDAEDVLSYSLYRVYNENGLLISQTDALGQTTEYRYDANRNKTYEALIGSGFCTHYRYDCCDRLIEEEQQHDDGSVLIAKHIYDKLSQKIASIDHRGHTTQYVYDELGRVIQVTYPKCLAADGSSTQGILRTTYNILGHVTSETNEIGAITRTRYNVRGQPTEIVYADDSQERFLYNLNGTLAKKWTKTGLCECYQYDGLDRVTACDCYDTSGFLVQSTRNIYQGAHLIRSIDPMGYVTHFAYDNAGRKIEESKHTDTACSRTTYLYDSLGRLTETRNWLDDWHYVNHIELFDALDRVVETRIEDTRGKLHHKECYAYSIQGDKTHSCVYDDHNSYALTETRYDSQRRPIVQIDALGYVTSIRYEDHSTNAYGQKILRKTVTDPLGNTVIEQYDPMSRVVSIEKHNAQRVRTAHQELFYDACGRKIKQVEHVLSPDGPRHAFTIAWTLDAMGRPLTIRESGDGNEKLTHMAYNPAGQLSTLTKPSGVVLEHRYDDLGRLVALQSSDQTVAYSYFYDANGQLLQVIDQLTQTSTTRVYDAWGRVVREQLANNLSMQYRYDALGRPSRLILPDGSGVEYRRDAAQLLEVSRISSTGNLRYTHAYSSYNLKGQARHSTLIGNAGEVDIAWDRLDRRVAIAALYWSETIPPDGFDGAGNLIGNTFCDPLGTVSCHFGYDDLYQLEEESGSITHSYRHDSIQNRLKKDHAICQCNGLNQLLSDSGSTYTYDPDGNLIRKCSSTSDQRYVYDALNRLQSVEEPNQWRVKYSYDSFGRRLSRSYCLWQEGWSDSMNQNFLYQDQREIGTYQDGVCHHLRILGSGKGAELGAAIALELQEQLYAPIHDHRGNVCCLLDAFTGKPAEFYRYSAFGEPQVYDASGKPQCHSSCGNPWQFASKRWDAATQLWQFGKRDYDCQTGRWLTPDPVGFSDGPNLYAYVHNNPLIVFDPWGLTGENIRDQQHQSLMPSPTMQALRSFGGIFGKGGMNTFLPNSMRNACSGIAHEVFSALGNYGIRPLAEYSQLADNFVQHVGLPRKNLDGTPCCSPIETHDKLFARGHNFIDGLFGTNLAQSYSHEVLATKQANCALGAFPGPGSLIATLNLGKYVPTCPNSGKPLVLPRNNHGQPIPSATTPHTQLGWRYGRNGSYRQTREWGYNGQQVKTTDWTDHGRPSSHSNPHDHFSIPNPTGGSSKRGKSTMFRYPDE